METEFIDHKEQHKRTIVIVTLLVFMAGLVYAISRNQPLHFSNKAATITQLDESQSKQVMVLDYSEASAKSKTHKLRVEVPHSFSFTPESISIGLQNGSISSQKLVVTENQYMCHDMGDPVHPMKAYETDIFNDSFDLNLDTVFSIIFTDPNGKQYESKFTLEHTCTVLGNDAVQVVTPPLTNNLPSE